MVGSLWFGQIKEPRYSLLLDRVTNASESEVWFSRLLFLWCRKADKNAGEMVVAFVQDMKITLPANKVDQTLNIPVYDGLHPKKGFLFY